MAREFHLSVVAPDRSVVETEVTSVVAPGMDGYFGVMAGHEPLIAGLKSGLLEYVDPAGNRHYVHVGGGFAEVGTGVTILADDAAPAQEIDIARTEAELESARRVLRGESSDMPTEEASEVLERAIQRLRAARLVQR
ncbi:MAG: ATP synthase F1 subunit epsilon [Armatimonadetes bacterium]|jgi:F-type H+-transporting ATPase subunit epsilon|nr:ATP synthase F1 subunit epsilon [Armatimonadota bacterium]